MDEIIKRKEGYDFIKKAEEKGMKIILKHKYGKHGGKVRIYPVFHEMSKKFLGIEKLSRQEKEKAKFYVDEKSFFDLHDGKEIDLSDDIIRMYWDFIKYSHRIAFTAKAAENSEALFYVFSAERQSESKVNRESLLYSVKKLIFEDDPKNLPMRIKFLGYNMDGDSTQEMLDFLLEIANGSPSKILDIYDEEKNVARKLFYTALSSGRIYKDRDLFIYNGVNLGATEADAILALNSSRNKHLLEQLNISINGADIETTKVTDKPFLNMTNQELIVFIGNKVELNGDEKRQDLIRIANEVK